MIHVWVANPAMCKFTKTGTPNDKITPCAKSSKLIESSNRGVDY